MQVTYCSECSLVIHIPNEQRYELSYQSQKLTPTEVVPMFHTFKLQQGTYCLKVNDKVTTIKLIQPIFALNVSNCRIFTYRPGQEFDILYPNHIQSGYKQMDKSQLSIKYNNLLPDILIDHNSNQPIFLPTNQTIQFFANDKLLHEHIQLDDNEQDFCFSHNGQKFYYQLFHMSDYEPLISDYSSNYLSTCLFKNMKIGHRGCGSNKDYSKLTQHLPDRFRTNSCTIAENTIDAFSKAVEYGLDGSEFDIVLTRDGIPVVNHNFEVNDLPVSSLTYQQFQKQEIVGFPAQIRPSFRQLLEQSPPQMLNVEIKYPSSSNGFVGLRYYSRATVIKRVFSEIQQYFSQFEDAELTMSEINQFKLDQQQELKNDSKHHNFYFSSFDPVVVLMLKYAQNRFPVFFLNMGTKECYDEDDVDLRINEVVDCECGLKFAAHHKLQGMVISLEIFKRYPDFVLKANQANLQVVTWGTLTKDFELIQQQYNSGIMGIIFDLAEFIQKE